MTLLTLAWEFLKIGFLSTGGGLATLPFLQRLTVVHPDWFSLDMLTDMVAISESTPGPLGINMATYVGHTVAGIPGGLVATLSLAFPSFLVITVIAAVLQRYMESPLVKSVFSTLRPAVTGLIAAAGYAVVKMAVWTGTGMDWVSLALFAVVVGLRLIPRLEKLHPIVFIAAGAVIGIALRL